MLIDRPTALIAAMLLIAGLTWSRSRWAIALLLAALPFFTHHPSSFPTVMLIVLVAVLETVYFLRARPSLGRTWRVVSSQPLLLLSTLFAAAAFLSLSALPLASIWHEHAATAGGEAWTAWPRLALEWVLLTEIRREFPITSVLLVFQGVVLTLIVWRETRASSAAAVLFARAITIGVIVFVGLGLLEAFGVVKLDVLRGAASVFVRDGTLQSASGNPGWFSQYLVYALPYSLVIVAGAVAPGLRLILLSGATGLMSFALLVSWQRGGWLFGALIILYVVTVAAILRYREVPADSPASRVATQAVVLTGLAFLLVVGAFTVWTAKARPGAAAYDTSAYLVRLRSIADADRLAYVRAGSMIASLHPVLGGGHESFAYRYRMYFEAPGGPFHASAVRVPEAASAHNVFIQALAGTGIVGAMLLAGIFVVAAWTGVRTLRTARASREHVAVVLAGCGSLLGIALYGLVQEVFYVHALRIFFFVSIGLVAGVAGDRIAWSPRVARALWTTLIAAFVAHLGYEYAWPGPDRLVQSREPTGLHADEIAPDGTRLRWSTDWATWAVPQGTASYSLRVRSLAPYRQVVEIEPCRGPRRRVMLTDHGWHRIGDALRNCGPSDRLRMRVTPGWRPPGDDRLLGVMTADVTFE